MDKNILKNIIKKNVGFIIATAIFSLGAIIFFVLAIASISSINKEKSIYNGNIRKLKDLDRGDELSEESESRAKNVAVRSRETYNNFYKNELCKKYSISKDMIETLKNEIEKVQGITDLVRNGTTLRSYMPKLFEKWNKTLEDAGMVPRDIDYSFNQWSRDQRPVLSEEVIPTLEQILVVEDLLTRITSISKKDCQTNPILKGIERIPSKGKDAASTVAPRNNEYFFDGEMNRTLLLKITVDLTMQQLQEFVNLLEKDYSIDDKKTQFYYVIDNVNVISAENLITSISKVVNASATADGKGVAKDAASSLVFRDNFLTIKEGKQETVVFLIKYIDFTPKKTEKKID